MSDGEEEVADYGAVAAAVAAKKRERGPRAEGESATLFLRGLPYDATSADLEALCSQVGPVKWCFVVADKESPGKNRGFGFVQYALKEDAKQALATLRKLKLKNRTIQVDVAKAGSMAGVEAMRAEADGGAANASARPARPSAAAGRTAAATAPTSQPAAPAHKHSGRLVLHNLPFTMSEADLRAAFAPFGTIVDVSLPTKMDAQGRPQLRGFGFVEFSDLASATKALALNATTMKGRTVSVDYALPKVQYDAWQEQQKKLQQAAEPAPAAPSAASAKGKRKAAADADEASAAPSAAAAKGKRKAAASDANEAPAAPSAAAAKGKRKADADEAAAPEKAKKSSKLEAVKAKKAAPAKKVEEDEDDEDDGDESEVDTDEEIDGEPDTAAGPAATPAGDKPKRKNASDVSEGRTVFVRNVSFDAEEDDLEDLFSQFGDVEYCVITMNPETGRSRGTAFVKFTDAVAAAKCVEAGTLPEDGAEGAGGRDKADKPAFRSVLQEQDDSEAPGLWLQGRRMLVTLAVDRGKAQQLAGASKEKHDKRNLYLAREGTIMVDSDAARGMSAADLAKRAKAEQEKKAKLANPNYFVSKTRLSIRNLPLTVDEKQLKKMFIDAARKRIKAAGSTEAAMEGAKQPIVIKQSKIMRSDDRTDANGVARSKGYGFVEYTEHAHALAALRQANNNPEYFGPARRPIVEFALESVLALKKREDRVKQRQRSLTERPVIATPGRVSTSAAGKRTATPPAKAPENASKPAKGTATKLAGPAKGSAKGNAAKLGAQAAPALVKGNAAKAGPVPARGKVVKKAAAKTAAKDAPPTTTADGLSVGRTGNAVLKAIRTWGGNGTDGGAGTGAGGAAKAPARPNKRQREREAEDSFQSLVEAHKKRLYASTSNNLASWLN